MKCKLGKMCRHFLIIFCRAVYTNCACLPKDFCARLKITNVFLFSLFFLFFSRIKNANNKKLFILTSSKCEDFWPPFPLLSYFNGCFLSVSLKKKHFKNYWIGRGRPTHRESVPFVIFLPQQDRVRFSTCQDFFMQNLFVRFKLIHSSLNLFHQCLTSSLWIMWLVNSTNQSEKTVEESETSEWKGT